MTTAPGRRGQPIVALAFILGGWIAARIVMWGGLPPVMRAGPPRPLAASASILPAAATGDAPAPTGMDDTDAALPAPRAAMRPIVSPPRREPPPRSLALEAPALLPEPGVEPQIPRPDAAPFIPIASEPAPRDRRWSADGWLMLRGGGAALAGGPAPATYGASQMGAVLRYRLDPYSDHRPAAYLRATAALKDVREQAVALGVAVRPIATLPIVAAAELRAARTPQGTRPRPAAMAVTEIAPIALPLMLRVEAYAQAGYVGGRDATAFADGQLRVDRGVVRFGGARLRAGAGLWGGAQTGAARLDFGPAATVEIAGGTSAAARLGFDWRFRVAGDAAPASGPALTLSAGF